MNFSVFDKSPFVDPIDAISRVKLFASNVADSSEIIRYGNVTRIPGNGITYGDGNLSLRSFPGERQVLTERCRDGSSVMLMTPDACPITDILAASACTADVARNSLYLCCKLQLDKKDPDSADGLWKRCFCDPSQTPSPGIRPLDFWSDGVLDCREEVLMINGYSTVVEVKFFKTANSPDVLKLYFKPNRSRLYINYPHNTKHELCISSELGIIRNPWDDCCWYQNYGKPEDIDFSSLRDRRAFFGILDDGASLRIRNAYAEAAAFKAAALHQGIRIPITTFHLKDGIPMQGVKGKEYVNAQREQLSDEDFVTRCKKHQVRIDPILCGDPYEIKLRQREITGKSLPAPFFERGRLSIFQELTEDQGFRKELFALTINAKSMGECTAPSILPLILCRKGGIHRLKKQLFDYADSFVIYQDSAILDSDSCPAEATEKLLADVQPELVFFDIAGYSSAQEQMLQDAIDITLASGICVCVFCKDGCAPVALREMADYNFIVGTAAPSVYIIKNKQTNGMEWIREFDFSADTVSVTDSDENKLAEAMREIKL